jgi:spore germination cell wall hydrolase CwlJ-like protein
MFDLKRVAAIATMTLGIAVLIGASTPGFALELDRVVNVTAPVVGPQPAALPSATPIPTTDPTVLASPQAPADQAEVDYASLSAAVAAQEDSDIVDDDLACMAGAVYFEAKGEPLSGQLAVAEVILNRARSGRFPKSICSVVKQPRQFSFVRGGRIPAIAGNQAYRTAVAVARVAMADSWDSPAADAMYFHTRQVSPGWHRVKVAAIGNHVFYR